MTKSNVNGDGQVPTTGGRLPVDLLDPLYLAQMVKEIADECCPALAFPGTDQTPVEPGSLAGVGHAGVPLGQAPAPTMQGISLPTNFSTGHFLDPEFLGGTPTAPYTPPANPSDAAAPVSLLDGARFGSAPQGNKGGDSLPWDHPGLLQGIGDPGVPADPTGLPALAPETTFYFLPTAAPSVPARPATASIPTPPQPVPAAPSPNLPAPSVAALHEPEGYYFLPRPPASPAAAPVPTLSSRSFQVDAIRQDFPILQTTVHGKPLIWLDNAATTQKPRRVIDALARFYERDNSNIHRAAHTLAARATELYESARDKVRRFIGAAQSEEIVFVHGATEAINLVAQTHGRKFIGPGDEIVLTTIEHHANIVPWQHLAQEKGAVLRVVPVNDRGEILLEDYEKLLGPRTRFVAMTHVSNALGTVVPVRTMTQLAHRHGATVLIDGAQSAPHMPVDVQALDADFYVLAGHKIFAPTGIGVLYGKRALLEAMPPWQGGGNMIDQVTFEHTTYQPAPAKFEAGTGILAGAVGLGAAIDYLDELGMDNISRYEHELLTYATEALGTVPGLRPIGTAAEKASVLSFVLEGVRSEDVGRYLDREGIAVRAGHHCAQPTMKRFGVPATVRPSLAFYNTPAEIDVLTAALRRARGSLVS